MRVLKPIKLSWNPRMSSHKNECLTRLGRAPRSKKLARSALPAAAEQAGEQRNRVGSHDFDSFNNALELRPVTPAAMIAVAVSASTMAAPEGRSNNAEASKPNR